MPSEAGDVSVWPSLPRPPRVGLANELFVKDPSGEMFALVPEVHRVTITTDGVVSVTPSIVSPSGRYHGFLSGGVWT